MTDRDKRKAKQNIRQAIYHLCAAAEIQAPTFAALARNLFEAMDDSDAERFGKLGQDIKTYLDQWDYETLPVSAAMLATALGNADGELERVLP